MSGARTNVVVVGVGGQGSVFVSRVLGEAALRSGLGVVASELHGMAQRGGVVESTVIIGRAHGPIVPQGEADLVIGLEPLESRRALSSLRRGGAMVTGLGPIVPYTVSMGAPPYPEVSTLLEEIGQWAGPVAAIDMVTLAEAAGEGRALPAVALGAAAGLGVLPMDSSLLRQTTIDLAPPAKKEANERAFDAGREAAAERE